MLKTYQKQKDSAQAVTTLTALFLAAVMLFCATWLADSVRQTAFYRRSRFIGSIVSLDSVAVMDLVSDRENLDLLTKFAGAVASAYIDFELIPIHEASTFGAVYESLNPYVTVESFSYRRKNLLIAGVAENEDAYRLFCTRLRETGHFQSVAEHAYTAVDDRLRFELECIAKPGGSYVNF